MNHNFQPLQLQLPEDSVRAQCAIRCKVTGQVLHWNDAVRAGWKADLNGEPFNAYYSPQSGFWEEKNNDTTISNP